MVTAGSYKDVDGIHVRSLEVHHSLSVGLFVGPAVTCGAFKEQLGPERSAGSCGA